MSHVSTTTTIGLTPERRARINNEAREINNLEGVLWSRGPFPRVTKSDECGICKETHFSKNPVLKRECSHYFHVSCHKGYVEDRASNQHLMAHEKLPLCAVCQQVTKVTNVYEERWVKKDKTVSETEEGCGNRRRAERKKSVIKSDRKGSFV